MITLTAGTAKAHILPDMGGGLAGLWQGDRPILRPWSGNPDDGPFALACNLLLPFSNRISHGGFTFKGQHHPIAPNLPGEPFPIHGDAFQRIWTHHSTQATADLTLTRGSIGPFLYDAQARYALAPNALTITLSLTNRATQTLPYGLGLHPWFPRDAATRLQFHATGCWPETAQHLPATQAPLPLHPNPWADPAPLPDAWINQGFSGWDSHARITQGPAATSLNLTATGLTTALLYSPSATADFFCFEPVTHPVDAHNLRGQPGLAALAQDANLNASLTLTWAAEAPNPKVTP
jgi:aldose 1-epimerase